MRSMKKVAKKLQQSLSILLSVAMVITCVPQTVFAAQVDAIEAETDVETVDTVDTTDVDTVDADVDTDVSDTEGITEEGGDEAEAADDAVAEPEIETADVLTAEEGQENEGVSEAVVETVEVEAKEDVAEPLEDSETITHFFNFTSGLASDAFDSIKSKLNITEDKVINTYADLNDVAYKEGIAFDSDNYFIVVKSVKQKLNSDRTSSIGVEVAKAEGGAIKFEVTGKATARLIVGSTSSSKTSHMALKPVNADGSYGAAVPAKNGSGAARENDLITGTKTSGETAEVLAYDNLQAGTYAIVSPSCTCEDTPHSGNAGRVYEITVVEEATGENPGETPVTPPTTDSKAVLNGNNLPTESNGYMTADKTPVAAYAYATAYDNCENILGTIFSVVPAVVDENDKNEVIVKTGNASLCEGTGVTVNNRLALNGPGSKTSRAVKFTAEKNGTLTLYALSSNSTAKTIWVVGENETDPTAITTESQKAKANPILPLTADVNAGETYYIYATGGGLDIYYLALEYDREIEQPTDELFFTVSTTSATYNGEEQKPDVTVKFGDKTNANAVPSLDEANYEVKFTRMGSDETPVDTDDFTSAGTITITVTGNGSYATDTPLTYEYEIAQFELKDDNTKVSFLQLDDETNTPEISVVAKYKDDNFRIVRKSGESYAGYDVEYKTSDGIEITATDFSTYVGQTVTAVVKGNKNFTGTVEKPITITDKKPVNAELESAETYYNGKAQPPKVIVTAGSKELTEDLYTVTYKRDQNGEYVEAKDTNFTDTGMIFIKVHVPAAENYDEYDNDTFDYMIKRYDLADNGRVAPGSVKVGDDGKLTLKLEAKFDTDTFQEVDPENYIISSYKDKDGADIADEALKTFTGDITITVTGDKNCSGIVTYSTKLGEGGVETGVFKLDDIANVPYTGEPQKPTVKVTLDEEELKEDEDYTVVYKRIAPAGVAEDNYTDVGTIEVTVTGKGEGKEYAGKELKTTYAITAVELTDSNVTVVEEVKDGTIPVTVTANGKTLTAGTDYDVTITDKDGAVVTSLAAEFIGTVNVTVTGMGNYTGTVTKEVTISDEVKAKDNEYIVTFVVKNKEIKEPYEVGNKVGDTLAELPKSVRDEIGTDIFEGLYTDSAFTPKSKWNAFSVVNENVTLYVRTSAKVEQGALYVQSIPDQVYTGAAIKPAVVVYSSDGVLLKNGKDYKLSYGDGSKTANTNANADDKGALLAGKTGTENFVTIEGKGNYRASTKVYFNIRQASIGSGDTFAKGFTAKINESLIGNGSKDLVPLTSLKYKKAMAIGTDYTVEVKDSTGTAVTTINPKTKLPTVKASGTYTFVIAGKTNFAGTVTKKVRVGDATNSLNKAIVKIGKDIKKPSYDDLEKGTVKIQPGDGTNTGFTVSLKSGALEAGADKDYTYEIVYAGGNKTPAVGKAQLIITAVDKAANQKCFGSKTVIINVTGTVAAKGLDVEAPTKEVKYTGKAQYQNDLKVTKKTDTAKTSPLVLKKDYTITYKNNVKKGTATMTFTMLPASGYTGSIKKTFKITAVDLVASMVYEGKSTTPISGEKLAATDITYSKVAVKPSDRITLKLDSGYVLKEGTDYTVTYKNNNKVNTATMTIKGKGSCAKSVNVKFDIKAADLKNVDVVVTSTPYKSGKDHAIKLKVTDGGKALAANKDYKLSKAKATAAEVDTYMANPATAARPFVYINGGSNGNYEYAADKANGRKVYLSFFNPKDHKFTNKNVEIETISNNGYRNGAQVKPNLVLKFNKSVTLNPKTDYVLTWGKNNTAGTKKGTVTVVGQGIYGGSATLKFDIVEQDITKLPPAAETDDQFTQDFYDSYIDANIEENDRLNRYTEDIDGIKKVTYDSEKNTFTVTVDDTAANVNMNDTFNKLFDKYKADSKAKEKYGHIQTFLKDDIDRADSITVATEYKFDETDSVTKSETVKVQNHKDWEFEQVVERAKTKYEEIIAKYNKLTGKDFTKTTLDKVVDKTVTVSVTINYLSSANKEPITLEYTVEFKQAGGTVSGNDPQPAQ